VTELAAVEAGAWRFLDRHARIDAAEDVLELARFLEEQPHKERTVIRLTLVGGPGLAVHARLEALLAGMSELYASLQRWERHSDLVVVPDALDAASLELSGYARAAWAELSEQARGPGDGAREACETLALFYRLAAPPQGPAPAAGAPS
jgi:hypothetical protein